jgi:putative transcriptional regulator
LGEALKVETDIADDYPPPYNAPMFEFIETPLFTRMKRQLKMRKMTEKQLAEWEKTRNIGDEILKGIQDIRAGRVGRRYTVSSFPLVRAGEKAGLTQSQFAALLGVSVRTLQDWEQGRRELIRRQRR